MRTKREIFHFFLGILTTSFVINFMMIDKRVSDNQEKLILKQTNKELLRKLRKANTDIIAAREIIQGNKLGTLIYR